jgi:hypothetical protein
MGNYDINFIPDVNDRHLRTAIFRECFVRHPEATWESLCAHHKKEKSEAAAQFAAYFDVLSECAFESARWHNPRKKRNELVPAQVQMLLDQAADRVIDALLEIYNKGEQEVLLQLWEKQFPHWGAEYRIRDSRQAEQRERAKQLIELLDAGNVDQWIQEMDKIRQMETTVSIFKNEELILEQKFSAR